MGGISSPASKTSLTGSTLTAPLEAALLQEDASAEVHKQKSLGKAPQLCLPRGKVVPV